MYVYLFFFTEVSFLRVIWLQDNHGKSEADTRIVNHEEQIEKFTLELADLEKRLETEETELESIVDGLRGAFFCCAIYCPNFKLASFCRQDCCLQQGNRGQTEGACTLVSSDQQEAG